MSFISRIFWWKKISELENLVEKQHEIIKELGERSKETVITSKKYEEIIEKLKNDIRREQRINNELKEDIETKTSLISEYEESIKTFKDKLKEVNYRYQEATEKYEKEKQNAIRLEMLILDLDKELGLLDISKKIEAEEKTPEITIKKLGR